MPSYFLWGAGQERRLQMLAEFVELKGAKILEVGCGLGTYAHQFYTRFSPDVQAIDKCQWRIEHAKRYVPQATVAPAEALPFGSNSFDLVFSNEVLEHVDDDHQAVKEMLRVARPGGKIILFCPNRWFPFETHGYNWKGKHYPCNAPFLNYLPERLRAHVSPGVRAYSKKALLSLFPDALVSVEFYKRVFPGFDKLSLTSKLMAKASRAILHPLEATPASILGLSHFLVIRKS